MWKKLKQWVARYDAWCASVGLAPEQRRSCCPLKAEDVKASKSEETPSTDKN
ncbi:hypothetical protein [Thaumasiovibrio subtropicus]|uniref:hypothetical protein n=1 Tax=Thaumasiovibrio subtropicus TaxID=1891207 RepID=UPI001864AC0A|nr:hypothetical protein [Thaumasiovibrio subtropicus]